MRQNNNRLSVFDQKILDNNKPTLFLKSKFNNVSKTSIEKWNLKLVPNVYEINLRVSTVK